MPCCDFVQFATEWTWTIPIWSDKNNWPIFVQQLFAAISLRSANQSPRFPLHFLFGRFLLSSFNISTWAKNTFCEGIKYIPLRIPLILNLNIRKFTLRCWGREQWTFQLPSRWLWRGRPHQGFPDLNTINIMEMHSMAIGLSAFNWGLPILHVSLVPFKLNLQNLDVNAFIHQKRANSPYGQLLEHFPIFSWSFVRHHSPPCGLIESKVFRANLFDRDLIQEREELLLIVILQCVALGFLVHRHQLIHIVAPALWITYCIWHVLSSCRMLRVFLVRFSKWLQSVKKVL